MRMAYTVHGRVQGVGFRYFVLERAHALGISGWVRNAHDGTVTGEAGGDGQALDVFRKELETGPSMAYVSRLDWTPLIEGESLPLPFEMRS